uniref:Late blight resistance protein homolog R1B-23 n=1 Tax=Nicotiana tabacum TaxID=4097 RepID=A0A1S3XHU3_TOBAC|nr:PREDICTED: putative late blight resistance protein homolog R1B-23 [Nicotiana tabacum]XP_016439420.1 PREDICTED: putative late blight resistance protein homolog R1B-23 [Nicotiana tabacum]
MAEECFCVLVALDLVKHKHLDSLTDNQLKNVVDQLVHVFHSLVAVEMAHPENGISVQLRALFMEALHEIDTICSRMNDQAGETSDIIGMISKLLKMIQLENIAERIKASKPSRSSSLIMIEMVGSVVALLDSFNIILCLLLRDHNAPSTFVFKMKLNYLKAFVTLTAKRCIGHERMQDLFTHAEDVAYSALHLCYFVAAYNMEEDDDLQARVLDCEFSKLLERISPFRPELRQIYLSLLIGSKSSQSETTMSVNFISDFVYGLEEDLEELLSRDASLKVTFDDRIPWLQQGLSYLYGFLRDIVSERIPLEEFNSLQPHIEALAIEAAIVIYSCYTEDMDLKTTEIDHVLFLLQLKVNHVTVDVHLIKLLNSEAAIISPLGNLIDYVQEELALLGTFLMVLLDQCKEQPEITDFLTLIQSVTDRAWSVIDSLSHCSVQENLAWEINRLHFELLLKFKFIREASRQMCPNISASSTLNHPTINLLKFLPLNFKVIDTYFSMLKSSKAPSSQSPKMDEILIGFHEYILDTLLLKDETYLTFTVANEIKKYYYGLLLLVMYLVDPPIQSIGWMKQNDFLTGFGTIAIDAESAIYLIYEDAVDKNKSRKVNLVLQFLTLTLKLIKFEECLMDLLKHKAALKAEILDLIESAHEELIFLRAFLMDVLVQHTELNELHDLLMHAEGTADKLGQIIGSCYESFKDGSSTQKMSFSLSDSLQEIESVKVEFRKICFHLLDTSPCNMIDGEGLINFLLNHQDMFLNYDACSISFLKNQILVVKDKSEYLGSFLADIVQSRNMHQELKNLTKRVQDIKYVCLFQVKGYKPAWYYMLYLSDVKQLLKYIEAEVKMICLRVPYLLGYSFPKTNGLGFLNCFVGKLEELLRSKLHSVIDLKHQIESVKEGLLCLRSLTDNLVESLDERYEFYGVITSVTEMVYMAEYVIDSCLAGSYPLWYKVLWISEVARNIKLEYQVVSETCGRKKIDVTMHKVAKSPINLAPSLSANTPRTNEEMEGFQEAMGKIKKQLLGGSSQLDIISIVGMAGIGKTTLAEKIYHDLIVTSHFDVHAKCRVTQVYSWKELLLTILNDVLQPADRTEKEDSELANELRQVLLTKRFLILIDDVWDKTAWDDLYMCFRDAHSGSRIILTTRLTDIAIYAKCQSNPHHLRLFRDDESWTLLQEEVFQGESCPPELVDVGSRIAKCCGGLPLFIVIVAGVLKDKENKQDLWKEVEETLGSHDSGSSEESMSLIGFSYKNLPQHLKPCFLYFGGFLKGKDIHVSKLTRLWQAEGFVQANKGKRTEDAAQYFFEDLLGRNLVIAMEKRPNDKVKKCRIHDLLHNFCLEKGKQENFLNQINRQEDILPEKPEDYRLFIHSYQDEIDLWRPCRSNVRSLQFKVTDPDNLLWPRDISFIFESFKLVKVLDLDSLNIGGTFPSEVQFLIHLRYFAVQTDANSIPSFIAKLWNLETFVVRGLGGEVILPYSLLKMVKLKHILVKRRASFSLHENMGESLANSQLNDLETFSTPRLSYGEEAEMILKQMPNLRKLSCIFSGTFGYSDKVKGRCVLFPRLEFLSHLESLKLVSNSYPAKLPHEFSFPLKLRELTLSKFRLPWSAISTIGELPNLEILKLLFRAFEGNQWEVKDSEFPKFKYLNLDNINISQWSVYDDAFPMIEHLVLTKCERLEEIPSHFGDAISLKRIEVNRCCWSVANSALEIQTTHHDMMGNNALTVTI